MRLIFLGTGPFAVPTLRRLHAAAEHEVASVVTRPPRRRRDPLAPMALAAAELELPLWQPDTVNSDESRERLAGFNAGLLVVCDYGEILKPETLSVTPLGGINLHGSLLPKYRGAAPVQWAILHGETETGNTVIQMTAGLDAGPCLGVQRVAIDPDESAGELEARLAELGAELAVEVIEKLAMGVAVAVEQESAAASRAPRLTKEDGAIDWSRDRLAIKNQIRALQPWPRAYTFWRREDGEPLRIIVHRAALPDDSTGAPPGSVVEAGDRLLVAGGDGPVELLEVQPAGKRSMSGAEMLRGNPIAVGDRLAGGGLPSSRGRP